MTSTLRKPALPLLLAPLVCCWVGIVCATEVNYQGLVVVQAVPFFVVAAVCVIGYLRFRGTGKLSIATLSILAFCLAFGFGNCFYSALVEQAAALEEFAGRQTLVVIEDTRFVSGSYGTEVLAESREGGQVRLRAFWNDTSCALPKGTTLQATCTVTALRDDQRWLFEKGVVGTLSLTALEPTGYPDTLWGAIDRFRAENVERITGLVEGEGGALLAGVVLGHREALQDSILEQDFITCGLSHLIAVSGSHLAVVAVLLSWFLKRLPLGRRGEMVILLVVLAGYVMLTGLQPSAIRSAIMAGVAGCSVLVGRRAHAPSALCGAALIMLLVYPAHAYSVGFWLSVFAVLGITLFANLVAHWISIARPFATQEGPGPLSSALALTLAASGATLPLAVPVFAVLSLIGPLANLLVAPLVSAMLVLGMLALFIPHALEPLGSLLLKCALVLSNLAAEVSHSFASIPFASTPLHIPAGIAIAVGVVVAFLLYFFWPEPQRRTMYLSSALAVLFAAIFLVALPSHTPARLVVMDVGQGDAILVQEQGSTILIDTGASESLLVHALARNGVHALDAVIITHLDSDHVGALRRLRGLVPVDRVYLAEGLSEAGQDNEYVQDAIELVGAEGVWGLTQGDTVVVGDTLTFEVLWPRTSVEAGSNEESICLLLTYDEEQDGRSEQQVLLTGDAEEEVLASLLNDYPTLTASLLKVGHHGSRGAINLEQLRQLSSSYAFISVGANNRYGHPSKELLEVLDDAGVRVLRTDELGDISSVFDGTQVKMFYTTDASALY